MITIPDDIFFEHSRPKTMKQKLQHLFHTLNARFHPAAQGCATCPYGIPSVTSRACHTLIAPFPVDVVYTWVDGADPNHRAKRDSYLPKQEEMHESGVDPARFRDNEELRYSLRSLERFAPWIRRIFIVSDNQVPQWLTQQHPKITLIDHKKIIPKDFLPTFNSHVIEAYIHNIPGLSEHYLYFNDDVFLGRPCQKTDFFTPNGVPLVFLDWRLRRRGGYYFTGTPHAKSYFNTLKILQEENISTNKRIVSAHGPFAQTLANAQAGYAFYEDTITDFAPNRFRTTGEICFYAHALPLLLYAQKRYVPCDERYYYVQTDRIDRIAYYKGILRSYQEGAPPLFFCINDVGNRPAGAQWQEDLETLLTTYFPTACSYEQEGAKAS